MMSLMLSLAETSWGHYNSNQRWPSRRLNLIITWIGDSRPHIFDPLVIRWGQLEFEVDEMPLSRQPWRKPWMLETFIHERAIAITNSLDLSTRRSYSSALNSWIAFVNMHNFPLEPTADSLSFFIVYMSHHIEPWSIKSYLSGIVKELEPDFPTIWEIRRSRLISQVLKGFLKLRSKPISRKEPLVIDDLFFLEQSFQRTQLHDNYIFATLLFTGFRGLLRLGDMTFPDDPNIREWRKVTRRSSLSVNNHSYTFLLPSHKGDKFFEGNKVLIHPFSPHSVNPTPVFLRYLMTRDWLFPASSPLWLTSQGTVPTRTFFMTRFHLFFTKSYAGASMRAGGATHLALIGASSKIIRGIGRWMSKAWELYIRVHPTLLHALLHHHHRWSLFFFSSFPIFFIPPQIAFIFFLSWSSVKKKNNSSSSSTCTQKFAN